VPTATATSGEMPPAVTADMAPPPPLGKKKRGFWGRIFGRGGDDERKETKDAVPPKKKP